MLRPILIILTVSVTSTVFAQTPDAKYIELIQTKVDTFEAPYGMPQVFEETIETDGFSEIRMFIHVFADNYTIDPVTKKSLIRASLFHTVPNYGSWQYSEKEIRSDVSSYINGWFSEKIIGKQTRIVAFAHDLPKGPYKVVVTYYLVK